MKTTSLVTALVFSLSAAQAIGGASPTARVFKATTDDFSEYAKVGPFVVDTPGKLTVQVKWTAKKKGLLASNKVSVFFEAYQKAGGHVTLKERMKKDASFVDEFQTSFRVTPETLNRARTFWFRVAERYTGPAASTPSGINVYAPDGKRHKIDYKIIVRWTPD